MFYIKSKIIDDMSSEKFVYDSRTTSENDDTSVCGWVGDDDRALMSVAQANKYCDTIYNLIQCMNKNDDTI